ncbi:endoribonuclease dicer 1-like protein [Trifolium pratense]|uniref:Endoribonuclease dicer 1-like protein n=1 Tax=Trifolium pratense TaxID=57577 RepID=A0A2K3KVI7_TRIPR|nr:endoribonuclease dicer 1-like protein [Trifolium pratense]
MAADTAVVVIVSVEEQQKARQYQLDVLEQAKNKNTIAFLETGSGKTLIVVLLINALVVI